MNILNLYQNPDLIGGSERAMHLSAEGLAEAGHKVYLVHGSEARPASAERYSADAAMPELWTRRFRGPDLALGLPKLRSMLDAWEIDLIHLHDHLHPASLPALSSVRPLVITFHVVMCPNGARYLWKARTCCDRGIGAGCFAVGYLQMGCGRLANGKRWSVRGFAYRIYSDIAFRRSLKCASRLLVNSQWHLQRMVRDGVAEHSMRVIPPPVPDAFAADARTYAPEAPPALIFTGRLVDFKGADHLIRASALIQQPHRVWFIGDGPARSAIDALANSSRISERVTFFGELPSEAVNSVRSRAAIVVVPSLLPETFCLAGPEGMLLGLPVVAYQVGGISDWLHDGVNGRLVEPGNIHALARAIGSLIEDPASAARMGEAGREVAAKWSRSEHTRRIERVFWEVLTEALPLPSRCVTS